MSDNPDFPIFGSQYDEKKNDEKSPTDEELDEVHVSFGVSDDDDFQDLPPFLTDEDIFSLLDMLMMGPPMIMMDEPGMDWSMLDEDVEDEPDFMAPDMLMLPQFFAFPDFDMDMKEGTHTSKTWTDPETGSFMKMETYSFCNGCDEENPDAQSSDADTVSDDSVVARMLGMP